jgi:hypothetical protein
MKGQLATAVAVLGFGLVGGVASATAPPSEPAPPPASEAALGEGQWKAFTAAHGLTETGFVFCQPVWGSNGADGKPIVVINCFGRTEQGFVATTTNHQVSDNGSPVLATWGIQFVEEPTKLGDPNFPDNPDIPMQGEGDVPPVPVQVPA